MFTASLSIGINPASATGDENQPVALETVEYAEVTGHDAQSPTKNQVATWCGSRSAGKKIEPVRSSPFQLEDDYKLVVVKAGANQQGNFANTLFGAEPSKGQWVWADTNGNGIPEVGDGDKDSISHIIVCFKDSVTPPTGSIMAIKKWTVNGPADYTAGKPGDLLLNDEVKEWDTNYSFAADTEVTVAEKPNGTPPSADGWTCTIDDVATTYRVGDGAPSTSPPTVTITSNTTVKVTITNTANCLEDITPPAKGSVEAVKQWTVTGLDPKTAQGFVVGKPGTLTFNDVVKPWTENTTPYAVDTAVKVIEAADGTPPTATGYKCTIDTAATTYTVGDTTSTTPPTVIVKADTTVKVTITNTANCASTTPPAVIPPVVTPPVVTPPVVTPPVVTPPVVTPPAVTPPVVTPPVPDVDEVAVVDAEEDVVEEESAVAGSEDELADTGADLTGGLGAILILAGAALMAARRFAIK